MISLFQFVVGSTKVCVVYNHGSYVLYVNGVQAGTATLGHDFPINTQAAPTVGFVDGMASYIGSFDDVSSSTVGNVYDNIHYNNAGCVQYQLWDKWTCNILVMYIQT